MSKDQSRNPSQSQESGAKGLSRRTLLAGGIGLAAAGVQQLLLRADAAPTESSGGIGDYGKYLIPIDKTPSKAGTGEKWAPTEDNILGPFYRSGAPFRAKITPPMAAGQVVLVSGRVWAFDTKKPLANAVLDIWQASSDGRYDNDDPHNPPKAGLYLNRARLVTDENGYYEFESIHPGRYQIGQNVWRPSHIHYMVQHPGYKSLVTQLYFKGDPHNKTDQFIKQSLIVTFADRHCEKGSYQFGQFDIVLAKQA